MKFIGTRVLFCVAIATSLHGARVVYEREMSTAVIAVDTAGSVYALSSGGITKLAADGSTVYTRPIGLLGEPSAIAVNAAGEVVIVGSTGSDNLPATPGVFQPHRSQGTCITANIFHNPYPCPDAFAAKFDAQGNLVWATYLGGIAQDQANAVAMDSVGNVFVAGLTQSGDFPEVSPFQLAFGGYADALQDANRHRETDSTLRRGRTFLRNWLVRDAGLWSDTESSETDKLTGRDVTAGSESRGVQNDLRSPTCCGVRYTSSGMEWATTDRFNIRETGRQPLPCLSNCCNGNSPALPATIGVHHHGSSFAASTLAATWWK